LPRGPPSFGCRALHQIPGAVPAPTDRTLPSQRATLSPSAGAVDAEHDNARDPYGKLWLDSHAELARLYDVTMVG
jgi:hypothetical protein